MTISVAGEQAAAPAEADEGLTTLVSRLVSEAKDYGRAEMAYVQALASERASDAGRGAALLVAAAVLAMSALTALLVGLVLALDPLTGPLLAALIVFAVTAAIAGLLAKLGLTRMRSATRKEDTAVMP